MSKMREIKFRAWNKKKKEMDGVWRLQFVTDNLTCAYLPSLEDKPQEVGKDIELMQYIGLKDRNGKEIYEGDIFKITKHPSEINEVTYNPDGYRLSPHGLHLVDWHKNGKIIGNIYENPRLLEEE